MVGKDWKLSAAELEVLATDKPFLDKIPEIVELTEEEMALINGGNEDHGYWHRRWWWHRRRWWHHRYW